MLNIDTVDQIVRSSVVLLLPPSENSDFWSEVLYASLDITKLFRSIFLKRKHLIHVHSLQVHLMQLGSISTTSPVVSIASLREHSRSIWGHMGISQLDLSRWTLLLLDASQVSLEMAIGRWKGETARWTGCVAIESIRSLCKYIVAKHGIKWDSDSISQLDGPDEKHIGNRNTNRTGVAEDNDAEGQSEEGEEGVTDAYLAEASDAARQRVLTVRLLKRTSKSLDATWLQNRNVRPAHRVMPGDLFAILRPLVYAASLLWLRPSFRALLVSLAMDLLSDLSPGFLRSRFEIMRYLVYLVRSPIFEKVVKRLLDKVRVGQWVDWAVYMQSHYFYTAHT
eukprot:ANDGO_01362.mRNA.1 hypothetical protein